MARKALKPSQKIRNAFESGKRLTSAKMKSLGIGHPTYHVWYLRHKKNLNIVREGRSYYLD